MKLPLNEGAASRAPLSAGPPAGPSAGLWAVSVPLRAGELPDLVAAGAGAGRRLWSRSGLELLGIGEALRLDMTPGWAAASATACVARVLGTALHRGDTGAVTGPLAMGALPYDPQRPGHLVVPALVLGRTGDGAWATLAGIGGTPPDERQAAEAVERRLQTLAASHPPTVVPDGFELSTTMSHEDWKQLVATTVESIQSGPASKVVLARRVDVVANRPFALHSVLGRLAALYPSCFVFHIEGFVGASPETLVRRHGPDILSHPLAGTVARSGEAAADDALLAALMASPKDRHEHQVVVDHIADALAPLCGTLDVPSSPSVMALRNVSHLGTPITGRLRPGNPDGDLPDALELAARLQPTPAVGGEPAAAAMAWQEAHEGFDRGLYAGPVGWVDASGDGEWALGLRSASVEGARASLYAGAGIVAGSDPEAELAETQLKLQALLAALVRP